MTMINVVMPFSIHFGCGFLVCGSFQKNGQSCYFGCPAFWQFGKKDENINGNGKCHVTEKIDCKRHVGAWNG